MIFISDILKIEDRVEFLRRMHKNVLAKIGSKKGINKEDFEFNYADTWKKAEENILAEKDDKKEKLKMKIDWVAP